MEVYTYATAGHAFNRDIDPSHYDVASAKLAQDRTLAFFERNLADG
jgi:carboxymethylenebutenolidase